MKRGLATTGTKARNRMTGKIGVIINDPHKCCGVDEVLVVYDGDPLALGTDMNILENLGPENAKADSERCGADQDEECCLFLAIDQTGVVCTRFTRRRDGILLSANNKTKKRIPAEMYPDCQLSKQTMTPV